MSLSDQIQQHGLPKQSSKRNGPIWRGPEQDGITFSLLSRFLACRERFRLYVVEGLAPPDSFNNRIEYGSFWHLLEESYAKGDADSRINTAPLYAYARQLCKRYSTQQDQVQHWLRVCLTQFPIYVAYWSRHPDAKRKPLLQEKVFNVPYQLPSGRAVRLRGKWDSVDMVNGDIWLQENKTKGDIDEQRVMRQLRFDLQTMLYLVALHQYQKEKGDDDNKLSTRYVSIVGVRYNVVRRPLSGGKHSIVRHKPTKTNPLGESEDAFYQRLGELICTHPSHFFMRWNVEITTEDVQRFRRTCLDPILEDLCDWWHWITVCGGDPFKPRNCSVHRVNHFTFPHGVYNPTLEGNTADLDAYLETGSRIGLREVDNLFPELTE